MSYTTSLIYVYGIPETPELKKRLRTKPVEKRIMACATEHLHESPAYCESCGQDIAGMKFCAKCGQKVGAKSKNGYCQCCGQAKVVKKIMSTETVWLGDAYGENECVMVSGPSDAGIVIGITLAHYDVREQAGSVIDVPVVTDQVKQRLASLFGRLGILPADGEPSLITVLQIM